MGIPRCSTILPSRTRSRCMTVRSSRRSVGVIPIAFMNAPSVADGHHVFAIHMEVHIYPNADSRPYDQTIRTTTFPLARPFSR